MTTASEMPRSHRLTVAEYYRMGEAGILRPDERVELIEGGIVDMAPPGVRHVGLVDQLAEVLRRAVQGVAIVRVQNPVPLDAHSAPQPDLALLRPRADYYRLAGSTAADVLLLVEVADSSLAFDRDVKVPLYARAGIPEVWLVDARANRLLRYREPADGTYRRVDEPDTTSIGVVGVSVNLAVLFVD